jgi:hypothetical protein
MFGSRRRYRLARSDFETSKPAPPFGETNAAKQFGHLQEAAGVP